MKEHITRRSILYAFLLITVIGWLAYGNTLTVPFYLDDERNIADNQHIRITALNFESFSEAALESPLRTRPVANLSFALNYYVHQYNLPGYHIVTIVLHILTAFFLYLLIKITFQSPALKDLIPHPNVIALFSAILWLVHPLNTQSVTYIVQRMNVLAGMFTILSLLLYSRARLSTNKQSNLYFSAAFLSFLFAIGSKENAASLPFFIVLYEWFFFQDVTKKGLKKMFPFLCITAFILIALYWYYLGNMTFDQLSENYRFRDFNLQERLLTQFRVVLFYLSLFFYPHPGRLSLEHDFTVSRSFFLPPETFASALVIGALLICAIRFAKQQRLLSFSLFWFFGNLFIESSFINLEIIFEHRTYVPIMFMCVALVTIIFRYSPSRTCLPFLLVSLLVVLCLASTYSRNATWIHPVIFWQDAVTKAPQNPRAHNNLGVFLRENGALDEAVLATQTAIKLKPDFVNAYVNLGNTYLAKNQLSNAETNYRKALQLKSDYAEVYTSLGIVSIQKGRYREAEEMFLKNLELQPNNVKALVNLASVYAQTNKNIETSIKLFEKASTISPENADIHFNLGMAYNRLRLKEKAYLEFKKAYSLNPSDKKAKEYIDLLRPY